MMNVLNCPMENHIVVASGQLTFGSRLRQSSSLIADAAVVQSGMPTDAHSLRRNGCTRLRACLV